MIGKKFNRLNRGWSTQRAFTTEIRGSYEN